MQHINKNSYFGLSIHLSIYFINPDLMDKKIVFLLDNNLRVIIPDFGAFIIRQQEPRIVVFNELLKNNDGLLIDYIMKTENVDCDMAQQILSDYTNHLVRTLEAGGMVKIKGIGSLCKDQLGNIRFNAENEIVPLEENKPAQHHVSNDEYPLLKVPVTDPVVQSNPFSVKNFFSRPVIKWVAVIVVANLLVILAFVVRDPVKRVLTPEKSPVRLEQSVLDQLSDSMMAAVQDTGMTTIENTSVLSDEKPVSESSNYHYYIVAGCFREEINADELVSSLKEMGYKAEKFGKIGGLFAVSFASFDDRELAEKELARIKKEYYPEAWMTKF